MFGRLVLLVWITHSKDLRSSMWLYSSIFQNVAWNKAICQWIVPVCVCFSVLCKLLSIPVVFMAPFRRVLLSGFYSGQGVSVKWKDLKRQTQTLHTCIWNFQDTSVCIICTENKLHSWTCSTKQWNVRQWRHLLAILHTFVFSLRINAHIHSFPFNPLWCCCLNGIYILYTFVNIHILDILFI